MIHVVKSHSGFSAFQEYVIVLLATNVYLSVVYKSSYEVLVVLVLCFGSLLLWHGTLMSLCCMYLAGSTVTATLGGLSFHFLHGPAYIPSCALEL